MEEEEEEEISIPTNEELWDSIVNVEGIDKADNLITLAIGYDTKEDAPFALALADEAAQIYLEHGVHDQQGQWVWVHGVRAERKAWLGFYDEAIESGVKTLALCDAYLVGCYQHLWLEIIDWYLKTSRYDEAEAHVKKMIEREKEFPEMVKYLLAA